MKYKVIIYLIITLLISRISLYAQDDTESITSIEQAVNIIKSDNKILKTKALRYLTENKADKKLVNQMKAIVNIDDPNIIVRKNAYMLLANINEEYSINIMKSQILKEDDKELLLLLNDNYNKTLLLSGNKDMQSEALKYFATRKTQETLSNLNLYIATENIAPENSIAANNIIESIERREKYINIFQNLFSGLSLGSILILVALGLSIIYGLAGVINMSHGEFLMIGAYTTYCIQELFISYFPETWFDAYFFVSLPISFVTAGLVGLILERLIIRQLYSRPLESLLATLGVSLILIQIARNIFGDLTSVKAPTLLNGGVSLVEGFVLPYNRLFIIGLTILVILVMYFTFQRTRLGVKIRAVTPNRNMSACVGISTKKIDTMTFFIGSGIAVVAGCALTLIGNVVPNMGQTYIVDSFLVVVTGGVGKLVGCISSGLGIGTLSKVFEIFFETIYGKVLMLAIIILFRQYKPKGLFPDKGRIGND